MKRDRFGDDRVDHEMRIAESVHVARGARECRRHTHQPDTLCSLHPTGLAYLDFRIARILQEWRQPTDLQLRPTVDQDIGVAQRDNKTRTRVDEMRILCRL